MKDAKKSGTNHEIDLEYAMSFIDYIARVYHRDVNEERKMPVAKGLISNYNRYGVMYCPCKIDKTPDTICPCRDMRIHMVCKCGLFEVTQ